MLKENLLSKVERLRFKIINHDKSYSKGEPIISDSDYGDLY